MRGCSVQFTLCIAVMLTAAGCLDTDEGDWPPYPPDVMPRPYPYGEVDNVEARRKLINPDVPYTGEAHAVVNLGWSMDASEQCDPDDAPDDDLKPGTCCPDCNPSGRPGACGRGKVGDGRVCVPCERCGGDGRIDKEDLNKSEEDIRKATQEHLMEVFRDAVSDTDPDVDDDPDGQQAKVGCQNPTCECEDCDCEDCDCVGPKMQHEDGKEVIPSPMRDSVGQMLSEQLTSLSGKLDDIDSKLVTKEDLDERLQEIDSQMVTKEEVGALVRSEIKRMQIEIETKEGKIIKDELELKPIAPDASGPSPEDQSSAAPRSGDVPVRIPGHSGVFMVPEGGRILSITGPDGVKRRVGGSSSSGSVSRGTCGPGGCPPIRTSAVGDVQLVHVNKEGSGQQEVHVYAPLRDRTAKQG